ncbi:F0F1 ATP synthase subunit B family protein [Micavibrio aeruginosavorus]|uniref:F0F1 ATP synthase subunit B family protein n=1 Tax=Micavibrio aeruginosavorus TaxID=349221 RepID=UPI003F4AC878
MIETLLNDTGFWVLLSFALFVGLAFKAGKAALFAKLDGRIAQIRTDIETAETLRVEAQELLAQYQRKQRDAQNEAEAIIANSRNHATEIRKTAEAELNEMIDRKEKQLADRLKRMEDSAKAEIRAYASELAVKATAEIIANRLDDAGNAKLIDQAIRTLPSNMN